MELIGKRVTVTGADGTFSVRVDIAGVQNGEHVITATGTLSGFTATGVFTIAPQVCATDGGTTQVAVVAASTSSLAISGFPTVSLVAAGLLAVLLGTTLMVVARRRREARASDGPSHL